HLVCLAVALCTHYAGYELARAASITLFASRNYGFGAYPSALPFTTVAVLPVSIVVLALYVRCIKKLGPRSTLLLSSFLCALFFLAISIGLSVSGEATMMTRVLVAALYIFREMYVSLLSTQVWGFLNRALYCKGLVKARMWLCTVQGYSCVISALAGLAAGRMSHAGGHHALLLAA
ncbi:unnamed protein product, partial [Choristocarpus tenellus]